MELPPLGHSPSSLLTAVSCPVLLSGKWSVGEGRGLAVLISDDGLRIQANLGPMPLSARRNRPGGRPVISFLTGLDCLARGYVRIPSGSIDLNVTITNSTHVDVDLGPGTRPNNWPTFSHYPLVKC